MAWHYYPYLRTEGGRWAVGPLFEDEFHAGLWLLQRLAKHLVKAHRIRHGSARWLEELVGEVSRFLRRETPYVVCPFCSVSGAAGVLTTRSTGKEFVVAYSADGDRYVRAGITAAALGFRAAMREMIRMIEEHARTHGAAPEAESHIEEACLHTRYRCPRCAFTIEVVPAAEAGGGFHGA